METALSLRLLQRRVAGPPPFEGWRSWGRTRFPREARPLLDLVGPTGSVPDFLTPPGAGAGGVHAADSGDELEGAIDTVLSTPRSRIRAELAGLAEHRTAAPWTRSLAAGERAALGAVGRAMRRYHQALVAPFQQPLREETERHASYAVRNMASGGLGAALNGLHPGVRWRPPFLELSCSLPGGRDRTGTAPSTVSHHTAVLRDAGLLTTRRTGTSVTHAATPLGDQLARQRPPFTHGR